MKKFIMAVALLVAGTTFAQQAQEINSRNSWLKVGVNAGLPVGDMSDAADAALGVELRGQFLETPNWGLGLVTGYNHFFAKDNYEDFGTVPLAAFARYYFKPEGLFLGVDAGYGFLTNTSNDGGFYLNPQIGYHNRDWNFFAFYQNTFAQHDVNVSMVGLGASYNIRF